MTDREGGMTSIGCWIIETMGPKNGRKDSLAKMTNRNLFHTIFYSFFIGIISLDIFLIYSVIQYKTLVTQSAN